MIKKIILNSLLTVVSLVLCLLLAEGGTRLLQKVGSLPHFDRDSLHKGFKQPEATLNAKTIPSDDPVLFHEYDTNDPRINSAGHRGAEFALEKDPDTYRIAVLGDSVAYGFGVKLEDTFAMRLQGSLRAQGRKVEVLNFAVSGYGTESQLVLFNNKVARYEPDLLLVAYVLNDPLPNNLIIQVLKDLMKEGRFYNDLANKTQFGAWLYLQYYQYKDQQKTHRNYEKIFDDPDNWSTLTSSFSALYQAMEGQIAVAIFPLIIDYEDYRFQPVHAKLMQKFAELNIKSLDVLPTYSTLNYQDLRIHAQDNTHPNALGHELAAQSIEGFILSEKLLPSTP